MAGFWLQYRFAGSICVLCPSLKNAEFNIRSSNATEFLGMLEPEEGPALPP